MSLPDVISFHSPKGWTNETVMLKYLQDVIFNHIKGKECALILDDYAAHWTPAVQKAAADGHIELIRVPKGLTSILQPLDVSFNSFLKQLRGKECSYQIIRRTVCVEEKENIVKREAVAYDKVTKITVLLGWKPCVMDE